MFWLIDYVDYGYIAINDKEEEKVDPAKKAIEDCFEMDDTKLYFNNSLDIRRFYWEDFEHLSIISDHKSIVAGNKFYIINKHPDKIINTIVNDGKKYSFHDITGTKPFNLRQLGKTKMVKKSDESSCQWYLHKIEVSLKEMNLPEYYYDKPNKINKKEVFSNGMKVFRFTPEAEEVVFDQNLALNKHRPMSYTSFTYNLLSGNDYRFEDVFGGEIKILGSPISSAYSSECAFIQEKILFGATLATHPTHPTLLKIDTKQLNHADHPYMKCATEQQPGKCRKYGEEFEETNGEELNSAYQIFGDFILRSIFIEKYHYLLNIMKDGLSVGSTDQFNAKNGQIRSDFSLLVGHDARIPIYEEPQLHWGGQNWGIQNIKQMNRVGRLWQFILNPICVSISKISNEPAVAVSDGKIKASADDDEDEHDSDIDWPDVDASDADAPDADAPDAKSSGASPPDADAPDVKSSGASPPDADAPDAKSSDVKSAKVVVLYDRLSPFISDIVRPNEYPPLYATNILDSDFNKIPQLSITLFIKLLETILNSIYDTIMTRVLPTFDIMNCYVLGGRAINKYVSKKYLKQSFDYDIHYITRSNTSTDKKCSELTKKLNEFINKNYMLGIRTQILNILLQHNIVADDDTTRAYFLDTRNSLFYYGSSGSYTNFQIYLGILCRPNLWWNQTLNQNVDFLNAQSNGAQPDDMKMSNHRMFYIQVCDFGRDDEPSCNARDIYFDNTFVNPSNSIRYSNFMVSLFELIRCTKLVTSEEKKKNNLKKLKKMINPMLLSCDIFNHETIKGMVECLRKFYIDRQIKCMKLQDIFDDSDNIMNNYTYNRNIKIVDYLNQVYMNVYNVMKLNICDRSNIMKNKSLLFDILPVPGGMSYADIELKNFQVFERFVESSDQKHGNNVMEYTGSLSRYLNVYCIYRAIGILAPAPQEDPANELDYKAICEQIDTVFNDVHTILDSYKNKDDDDFQGNFDLYDFNNYLAYKDLFDEFTVFTFQDLFAFSTPDTKSLSVSNLKIGDIFSIPAYMSTTYDPRGCSSSFDHPYRLLFKIIVQKESKGWMILNNYSKSPSECEILLKRNCFFVIDDIDYTPIEIITGRISKYTEFHTFTLRMYDGIPEATAYATKYTPNTNQPITSDIRFKTAAEFVYDNYLSRQYKDAPKEIKDGIWRNVHALANSIRKSLYIPVIVSYIIKAQKTNTHLLDCLKNIQFTYESVLKLCILTLFAVVGRQSEVSVKEDLKKYNSYLKDSCYAFANYARKELPDLFADEEIEMYSAVILFRFEHKEKNPLTWILNLAHDFEMMRLEDREYVHMNNVFSDKDQTDLISLVQRCLLIGGETIGTARLNGIELKEEIKDDSDPNKTVLFQKANIDPYACIKDIHGILYADNDSMGLPGTEHGVQITEKTPPTSTLQSTYRLSPTVDKLLAIQPADEKEGIDSKMEAGGRSNVRYQTVLDIDTMMVKRSDNQNIAIMVFDMVNRENPSYFTDPNSANDPNNDVYTSMISKVLRLNRNISTNAETIQYIPYTPVRKQRIYVGPSYKLDKKNVNKNYDVIVSCFVTENVSRDDRSTYDRFISYSNLLADNNMNVKKSISSVPKPLNSIELVKRPYMSVKRPYMSVKRPYISPTHPALGPLVASPITAPAAGGAYTKDHMFKKIYIQNKQNYFTLLNI